MTRKTGEAMTEYSNQNEGFIGKLAGFGGRINTAVGASVENVARKGKRGELEGTKTEQFVAANKEVVSAAFGAVDDGKALTKTGITDAQRKLIELGYYSGPADGVMGKQTIHAIEKYQISHKLPVTKVFDRTTLAALGINHK